MGYAFGGFIFVSKLWCSKWCTALISLEPVHNGGIKIIVIHYKRDHVHVHVHPSKIETSFPGQTPHTIKLSH